MRDNPTLQPRTLQEVTGSVIRQLMNGKSQEFVIGQLVARGWPEVSARTFVANAARNAKGHHEPDEERQAIAEYYRRRTRRSFVLSIVSLAITLVAFSLSGVWQTLSFISLSMTVYVVVDFVVALIAWLRYRR
jgi:hypothetical protein